MPLGGFISLFALSLGVVSMFACLGKPLVLPAGRLIRPVRDSSKKAGSIRTFLGDFLTVSGSFLVHYVSHCELRAPGAAINEDKRAPNVIMVQGDRTWIDRDNASGGF